MKRVTGSSVWFGLRGDVRIYTTRHRDAGRSTQGRWVVWGAFDLPGGGMTSCADICMAVVDDFGDLVKVGG